MRVNVYAEEMTRLIEIKAKEIEGQQFTGLRFWLHLPVTLADGTQAQGPFMHHPDDDDSSAVTFWGKRDLREVLRLALARLDEHYGARDGYKPHQARVVGEKAELDDKLAKLRGFMLTSMFRGLELQEQSRLARQAELMAGYSAVLQSRINAFGVAA